MIENYTKEEYAKAYTELLEILKHISKESLNKIPKEKLDMYNKNKDKNYTYKYDEQLEFEEQNILQLTRILIANLYIEYWAEEDEKNEIKQRDRKELEQIEKEKREKYNPDNLFNNKKSIEKEEILNISVIENKNIFKKLLEKIKRLINK